MRKPLDAWASMIMVLLCLIWGFVALLLFAALSGQLAFSSSPLLWISLGFQAIGVGFFSYLVWLWLMKRYLVSRLGVLSFMTPLFGVLMGALLLNEPLEPVFLLGALLVLVGVVTVNGQAWLRQFLAARAVRRSSDFWLMAGQFPER